MACIRVRCAFLAYIVSAVFQGPSDNWMCQNFKVVAPEKKPTVSRHEFSCKMCFYTEKCGFDPRSIT